MAIISKMVGLLSAAAICAGCSTTTLMGKEKSALSEKAKAGSRLFEHNCASCHGDDARGDEGPDLHGLTKSDERIAKIIKGGIKGEMPAFGKKFSEEEVQALIAFLRTLKN